MRRLPATAAAPTATAKTSGAAAPLTRRSFVTASTTAAGLALAAVLSGCAGKGASSTDEDAATSAPVVKDEPDSEVAQTEAAPAAEWQTSAERQGLEAGPLAERSIGDDSLLAGPLAANAPASFEGSKECADLLASITNFEDMGCSLGFVMRDLMTGASLAYNEHQLFYPASSMKGPYCAALYQEIVESGGASEDGVEPTVQKCIVDSDNDAFRALHDSFGWQFFANWAFAEDGRVPDGDYGQYVNYNYPLASAADMAGLWQGAYDYLRSGSDAASHLAGIFEARTVSPIADGLLLNVGTEADANTARDVPADEVELHGELTNSWAKAGWYYASDGLNSEPSTCDCGVVFAASGTYLLAFVSNAAGDFDAATSVIAAIEAAHDVIVETTA